MKSHVIKLTNKRLYGKSINSVPSYKKIYINAYFDVENRLKEFVVFDTETTGLQFGIDKIVQLSAVKYRNLKPVESWNTYINPGRSISDVASAINGITDEIVADQPKINEVANDFLKFVGTAPIVGYNIDFDLKFMWCAGIDLITGRDIYDVMLSAYALFPKGTLPNRKLTTVAEALNINFDPHDSLEDSIATGEILVQICKRYCRGNSMSVKSSADDIRKQMGMDYDTQINYLLNKYGSAQCDYFLSEYNLTKNREISRTAEGLECHHIDEYTIPTLSDPAVAAMYSYDYQKKERLVYCNLLEHLLLHIKIGQDRYYENHKTMRADKTVEELITHGVNMLSMQINRLYENRGSNIRWEQNCFEVIADNYQDYVEMLKRFQYFIVEHVVGMTEFEKPVYLNRTFIDEDTGEIGKIVEITETEVKVEMESEYWTYERKDFETESSFERLLDAVHEKICSTDFGTSEQLLRESKI